MTLPLDPLAFAHDAEEEINRQTNFRGMRRQVASLPEILRGDRARALFRWWRDAGAPPPRSAFDIAAHALSAAHLYLIRRRAPAVFEYRLAGEDAIAIVGRNGRGHVFDGREQSYRGSFARYLEQVAAGRQPWYCVGEIELAERPALIPFESLDCPLTGEDGSIAWILGVIEAVDGSSS